MNKKKCEKLYGESANKEWRVLESLCTKDHQDHLDRFVETADWDALLCYECMLELDKVDSLRAKLENVSSALSVAELAFQYNTAQHSSSMTFQKKSAPEEEPCTSRTVADSSDLPAKTPVTQKSAMSSPPVEVSIIRMRLLCRPA